MKVTQVLLRQHIGRHIKQHWWIKSKIKPTQTIGEHVLRERGVPIYKPDDILKEKIVTENIEVVGLKPKPPTIDKTHPNWHDRICYTFRDENVLLEGLAQAKIITNTIEVKRGLPDSIDTSTSIKGVNTRVKEIIFNAHLFDAEQEKLPKIKDPLRPAFNFPRVYGITEARCNTLIIGKLLQLIEVLVESQVVKNRAVFNDLYFSYPFEKNGDLLQFELKGDTLLTSTELLRNIHDEDTSSMSLPNIDPIKETITLNKENVYEIKNCYPIDLTFKKCHPHTLFVHHNQTDVKNIYEEEVTESQIHGRSLIKAFAVVASYAKQLYGENVKDLPKPITLQCVHTNGRLFHFGILQLNTLNLENVSGRKNIWYQTDRLPLFEKCMYEKGKPVLEGYKSDVIKHLLAFYNNI